VHLLTLLPFQLLPLLLLLQHGLQDSLPKRRSSRLDHLLPIHLLAVMRPYQQSSIS
jgi:hypothetical protein